MTPLLTIIKSESSDKEILSDKLFKVTDTWKGYMANFPASIGKYFYLQPLQVVETENAFYIDRRPSYTSNSKYLIIPTTLFSLVAFYSAYTNGVFVLYLFAAFIFIMPFWNMRINRGKTNILTIKKSWISEVIENEGEKVLVGEIIANEHSGLDKKGFWSKLDSKISTFLKVRASFRIVLKTA